MATIAQHTHRATNQALPDKAQIRAEWQAMQQAFHQLLGEIPPSAWRRRSKSTRWTLAELCAHVVDDAKSLPLFVEQARQGKNYYNMPSFIGERLNCLNTKFIGRKATPEKLAAEVDKAVEEAMRVLDGIQADEWQRGAHFFGEGYWTIAYIFRQTSGHFAEHATHVRESL